MTLKELKVFQAVSDNANLTYVAKELGMTQSNVSLSIKSLEKKLGKQLFERVGKKLLLNENGRVLLFKAISILDEVESIYSMMNADEISGNLKIGATNTIADYLLSVPVYAFSKENEKVHIEQLSSNTQKVAEMVCAGELELGLIEGDIDNDALNIEVVKEDELLVVSSNEALSKESVYIDELLAYDWILREKGSGTRSVFLNALKEIGVEILPFLEFEHTVAIKNVLKENTCAISCLSHVSIQRELHEKTLFHVRVKNMRFTRNLYLIYRKDKFQSKLFQHFCQFIRKNL